MIEDNIVGEIHGVPVYLVDGVLVMPKETSHDDDNGSGQSPLHEASGQAA
jgi:hypothetical protein